LQREQGPPVLVDLGWVPLSGAGGSAVGPAVPGREVEVEGYTRPPEHHGWFAAPDDAARRRVYTLDPATIGAMLGLGAAAEFTLVALGPPSPGVYPEPARALPHPPNDHLGYALTWFGLAAALLVCFVVWSRSMLR
jgi:surfeit locus 1 family protein